MDPTIFGIVYTKFFSGGTMKNNLVKSIGRWLAAVLLTVFAVGGLMAQQGTSTVRGTVVDQQGNVVAGATVTLSSTATKSSRTAVTSDGGTYSFDFIAPGDYRVNIEAKNFKKSVVKDVHALISNTIIVDVRLDVGSVSETVTVSAGAAEALINRDDATIGNTMVAKQILELPLEAKNVPNLLTLQPATTRTGETAGARSDQSNITLDGVDINDAQTNQILGGDPADSTNTSNLRPGSSTVLRLNAEAVEEFRVTTSNPNANQGRSSGAQISLVTKGGTNEWHGSLSEYYRTKSFQANDFFSNKNGVPRPSLIRHTFGGAVGGPIVKDRAFFFYSFEGDRITQSTTVTPRTVPLPSLGAGTIRYVNPAGGITTLTTAQLTSIFPAVGINPAATAVLAAAAARYPANDFGTGDGLNYAGYRFNAPIPVIRNSHTGRFDINLTGKQQAFIRASVIYDKLTQERQFPDSPAPQIWSHPIGIAAGHTWTISNSLINNFRYGFTREAFTQQGDSAANAISFRFIYSPLTFSRTLTRITPVQNFTDDLAWIKGSHTFTFGGNIRLIRNRRGTFSSAFDSAVTNPSGYAGAGASLSSPINTFSPISGSRTGVQNATTAIIGRFSQYTTNFNFNRDGTLLPSGSPSAREFRTEEYDAYMQDSWKAKQSLTFTYGLRYSISRPVYEKNGFEVKTTQDLTEFFNARRVAAAQGVALNTPITLELSGPANKKSPLYRTDKNNFQPRIAAAWSPSFKSGVLSKIFGSSNQSSVRGGFAITNDYYGQQLAVTFDLNNTLGFSSNQSISVNTYNVTTRPAPQFTGFGQAIRGLPNIISPGNIAFPRTQPFNTDPALQARRIESTLDQHLVAPISYSWNVTFERELPHGTVLQMAYIGRKARHLIASRDVMALNNLVDTRSGTDWYSAATQLEVLRQRNTPISQVQNIPWFQNMLPANIATLINNNYFGGTVLNPALSQTQAIYQFALETYGNDWTDTQDGIEAGLGRNIFFHPQYGALSTFSSIGNSDYNAGTLTIRQRLGTSLTMDFNYTLSQSFDDASGTQTSASFGNSFILNPLRQRDSYSLSNFDMRHIVNANFVWSVPFGKGRYFLGNSGKVANAILGGWQVSGIFRWNSGLPISAPIDDARWATNWNAQSNVVRTKDFQTCPIRGDRLFGCNTVAAYSGFRNAYPGETGDRNVFRLPGYIDLDMGLSKTITTPWSEKQKLQIRIEGFNVTNTQRMGAVAGGRDGFGVGSDPQNVNNINQIPTAWTRFVGIQGKPRVLQLGVRYSF